MSKDIIIGILVVVFLIGGGILLYNAGGTSPTATTTPTGGDGTGTGDGTTPTPTPTPSSAVPTAVTDQNNVVVSNSTSLVTGKVTPNGAPTSYWYEYGKTSSLGNKTENQTIGSGFVVIQAPSYIINLTNLRKDALSSILLFRPL